MWFSLAHKLKHKDISASDNSSDINISGSRNILFSIVTTYAYVHVTAVLTCACVYACAYALVKTSLFKGGPDVINSYDS